MALDNRRARFTVRIEKTTTTLGLKRGGGTKRTDKRIRINYYVKLLSPNPFMVHNFTHLPAQSASFSPPGKKFLEMHRTVAATKQVT